MYRSICVPLDGSAFAEHALPIAASLAKQHSSSLTLVRVHVPLRAAYAEGALFFDQEMDEHFKKQDQSSLEFAASRLQEKVADVNISTKLLDGEISEAISSEVISANHDLVVMTTHGRGNIGRLLLGSVAEHLIRQLPTPLLLVRSGNQEPDWSKEVAFRNIFIPLDGSKFAEQILEPAIALGEPYKASYTLTRIVKPVVPMDYPPEVMSAMSQVEAVVERMEQLQDEIRDKARVYLDEIAAKLKSRGLTVETRVDENEQPASAILRDADELQPDLIALSTHARHGLPRLFLGSVANKLIRSASCPVLVQRPKQE